MRRQVEAGNFQGCIKELDTHAFGISRNEDVISKEKMGKLLQASWKAVCAVQVFLSEVIVMKIIRDCLGRSIRLTDERMAHILQHPEMIDMEAEIDRVLQSPSEVRLSRSDQSVQLFYEYYAKTRVGGKWLSVVVKYANA